MFYPSASFFLDLETLSISLPGSIANPRERENPSAQIQDFSQHLLLISVVRHGR
jgi:hypothetical protein